MWTNADEVKAFIEDHKGGRWEIGDRFVLPDIGQVYTVIAVRPFKHRGKFKLFVDFDAQCAVDDCGEYLITTKEVHQWMSSPHLVRCCQEHRGGFVTPMVGAWKTSEQIAQRPVKVAKVKPKPVLRVGANERAVLEAVDTLSLVSDKFAAEQVISHAVEMLPPARDGKRDTRRQRVTRALASLADAGRVSMVAGVVRLACGGA
jgi:hypothetical protein